MTDKAAREAFDPAEIERLITGLNILSEDSEDDVVSLTTNFAIMVRDALLTLLRLQAAHDAAMAAEPDAVACSQYLHDFVRERVGYDQPKLLDCKLVIDRYHIQLQAAQQREANAIMASNELAMSAERAMAGLIAERRAAQQREAGLRNALEVAKAALDNCYFEITDAIFEQDKAALKAVNAALATQPTSKGETT